MGLLPALDRNMVNEKRVKKFLDKAGPMLDRTADSVGGLTLMEVTVAICRLAAVASTRCNPNSPAEGIEFGYNEFLNQIHNQCVIHQITGVDIIGFEFDPKESH